jgi:hypothetical protein
MVFSFGSWEIWDIVTIDDEQNIFKLGLWWPIGRIASFATNAPAYHRLANPIETSLFDITYLYDSPV